MVEEEMSTKLILQRIRKNFLILIGSSGVASLFTFGAVALNARALGADGMGIITLIQGYASLIVGVFSMGTQQPVIRLGSQMLQNSESEKIPTLIALGLLIDVSAGIVAGIVGLSIFIFIAPYSTNNQISQIYFLIYIATAFVSGIGTMTGVMRLFDHFSYIGMILVFHAALNLIGSFVLFDLRLGIEYYLIFYSITLALSNIAYIILGFFVLRSKHIALSVTVLTKLSRQEISEFLAYGWTIWAASAINSVRTRLDILFLGLFAGIADVGVYGVVRQVTGLLSKVNGAVTSATFPEVAQLAASKNEVAAEQLWKRLAVSGMGVGLVSTMAVFFLGPEFLRISFGDEFSMGSDALTLLFLAGAIMLSASTFGGFIQVFISPRRLLDVYIISTFSFVLGLCLVLLGWGMLGASIAQLAFSISVFAMSAVILINRFRAKGQQS